MGEIERVRGYFLLTVKARSRDGPREQTRRSERVMIFRQVLSRCGEV